MEEEQNSVSIEFARRALNVWCRQKFQDEKVIAYVFNRFPNHRTEWLETLKQYNLLNDGILAKWGNESIDNVLHLFSILIKGDTRCKMSQINQFLNADLDQNLHATTKQIIDLVNQSEIISNHFIEELLFAVTDNELKLSTRILAFQLLTMKKIKEEFGSSRIAQTLLTGSLNAPRPLGALMYNISRQMNNSMEIQPINLKLVARSNRYMNEAYGEIEKSLWKQILHAFHTQINQKHSIENLKYSKGFSNKMIVKDLLHRTNLESPVDPFLLCEKLSILVKEMDLPKDIEAFTIKSELADKGMIVLNAKNSSEKRRRFTLAHEIGHFIKHSFPNDANILVDENIKEEIIKENDFRQYVNLQWEKDANDFAHQLLLPSDSDEVNQLRQIQSDVIEHIAKLSDELLVSMSMLASKLVSVTELEMILVISENGEIIFSKSSPFWEEEKIALYNSSIPNDSDTYDFIHSEEFSCSKKSTYTNLQTWKEGAPFIPLKEEVFATGYGKVYTFLYK